MLLIKERRTELVKLNIGSGTIPKNSIFANKDWTNVDFYFDSLKTEWHSAQYLKFDLSDKWLIETESVDCIFASHIFEHFTYVKLWKVVMECYRVLKKGHPIRVVSPDPRIFIRNWEIKNKVFLFDCYSKENYDKFDYENNLNIAFTDIFFYDHCRHALCTSIDYIKILMIRTGFTIVKEMACGNTMFPEYFREKKDSGLGSFDNRPEISFYLECVK